MANLKKSIRIPKISILILAAVIISLIGGRRTNGQVVQENPEDLQQINVVEHLNEKIPLDFEFIDENGENVSLSDYFGQGRPVILILGYYTCPMLCNLVFNGVRDAVMDMDWLPGNQFQIVTVSIDPTETNLIASAKKKNYIESIGKDNIDKGWVFLTGRESQSAALAEAVGFKYFYDKKLEQYAHPAVLTILTDEGVISRYLYGIQFDKRDLRLALLDASEGKIGNTLDRILLYCYHYDPDAGGYVVLAGNVMKLGGVVTLFLLGGLLSTLWFKERRKRLKKA